MPSIEKQALQIAIQLFMPVIIWGPPGIGKSSTLKAIGRVTKRQIIVESLGAKEPADFTGLPCIIDGEVRYVPTAWARKAIQLAEENQHVLVIFDEINRVYQQLQNAALSVIDDKRVGEVTLPENVSIVAAANPPGKGNLATELDPTLANRFIHISWRLNVKDWIDGMESGWADDEALIVPGDWRERYYREALEVITGFINVNPGALHIEPTEASQESRAWPSPRTWEFATQLWAAGLAVNAKPALLQLLVGVAVGEPMKRTFWKWYRDRNLIRPESVLENPEGVPLPTKQHELYMLFDGVMTHLGEEPSEHRYQQSWKFLARVSQEGKTEVAAGLALNLARFGRKRNFRAPIQASEFAEVIRRVRDEESDDDH